MPDELQDTKSDQNDNRISEPGKSGPFKWFVLITYIIFSSSLAMSEIIFAPVPKQAYGWLDSLYININKMFPLTKSLIDYFGRNIGKTIFFYFFLQK